MRKNLASKLAEHEIGWWQAHHRRDKEKLIEHTAKSYQLQYNTPYKVSLKAAELRLKATHEYNKAKGFDGINKEKADKHWNNAKDILKQAFELLISYSK
ncbi:MAG: hypothetical protein AABW50_00705 [Nanoarchaeota archaeon]